MLKINIIESAVKKSFNPHLTGQKHPKYKINDVRFVTTFLSLQHGHRQRDLVNYFNVKHTTIIYYEKVVTDISSYDKIYHDLIESIKIKLHNIILNSNEN